MLHIFTLWYGKKYSVDSVNSLYKSIKKFYKKPFTFYCYTDKKDGATPAKLTRGIKTIYFDRTRYPFIQGAWPKLEFFRDNFVKYKKGDECICLDIDQEVVNDPTPLFEMEVPEGYIGSLHKWWNQTPNVDIDGGYYKWVPNTMNYIPEKFFPDYEKWQNHYFDTREVTVPFMGEQNFVFENAKGYVHAPGHLATRWKDDKAKQLNYAYQDMNEDMDWLRIGDAWSEHVCLVHYSKYIG